MTTGTRLLRTECCLPNCCAISLHMKNSWLPHFQFFFSSTNNSTSFSRPLTIVSVAYLIANWVSHENLFNIFVDEGKKMFCDDVINLTHTSCLLPASTQTWFLHMFFLYILACTIMIQKLKWQVLHQKISLHHTTFNFIHVIKFNKYFPSPLEIH